MAHFWEEELFGTIIKNGLFLISDPGPLDPQIVSFSFDRNVAGDLILTTELEGNPSRYDDLYLPGVFLKNDSEVKLISALGWRAAACGVVPYSKNWSVNRDSGKGTGVEKSLVNEINIVFSADEEVAYLVEHVDNLSPHVCFPERTEFEETSKHSLTLSGGSGDIKVTDLASSFGGTDCLNIEIGPISCFVLRTEGRDDGSRGRGCIIYKGEVPPEGRQKLRDCLSFFLGKLIVYLGYGSFTSNWGRVNLKAVGAFSVDGRAYDLPVLPPAPFSNAFRKVMDKQIANHFIGSLYSNYDRLDFLNTSWAYWYAVSAPVHIAAIHFGALIESLQSNYLRQMREKLDTSIIDKKKWAVFRGKVLQLLSEIDLEPESLNLAQEKINLMNRMPQGATLKIVFRSLNLNLSELENAAWKSRNRAAHGSKLEKSTFVQTIRNNYALRNIVHRLILRLCDASQHYYDYYTEGHPIRPVFEATPGP